MKIWIISDTHFQHEKIKKFEHRPDNFDEVIIRNWNKRVAKEDLVIHLGDVIFAEKAHLTVINSRLNGKKILCRGNHDNQSAVWYMDHGFDFAVDYFIYNNIAYSHAPLTPLPFQTIKQNTNDRGFYHNPVDINIHGHFHRGLHRGQPGMLDRYFDEAYYAAHKSRYRLVQIEDELRPFSIDEILQ